MESLSIINLPSYLGDSHFCCASSYLIVSSIHIVLR